MFGIRKFEKRCQGMEDKLDRNIKRIDNVQQELEIIKSLVESTQVMINALVASDKVRSKVDESLMDSDGMYDFQKYKQRSKHKNEGKE